MKRTELQRKTSLKRGGRLRPRSKSYRGIPAKVRQAVRERSGGRCEAQLVAHECVYTATHQHHILPRSSGGKHAEANLIDVCWKGHAFIHAHPSISERLGYLERTSA